MRRRRTRYAQLARLTPGESVLFEGKTAVSMSASLHYWRRATGFGLRGRTVLSRGVWACRVTRYS